MRRMLSTVQACDWSACHFLSICQKHCPLKKGKVPERSSSRHYTAWRTSCVRQFECSVSVTKSYLCTKNSWVLKQVWCFQVKGFVLKINNLTRDLTVTVAGPARRSTTPSIVLVQIALQDSLGNCKGRRKNVCRYVRVSMQSCLRRSITAAFNLALSPGVPANVFHSMMLKDELNSKTTFFAYKLC